MRRLRRLDHPHPGHSRRRPNLHGLQGQRPGHPDERSHRGESRVTQRHHHAAAGVKHDAERRRISEESELRVVQVPEHDDHAVLPRNSDWGGAWTSREGEGASDDEYEYNGGCDNGSGRVTAGSGFGYEFGASDGE